MSICPKCGSSLPDSARFCSSCGSPLTPSSSGGAGPRYLPQRQSDAFRNSRDYRSSENNAFNNGRASYRSSFGSGQYNSGQARRSYDPNDPFGTAQKNNSRNFGGRSYDSGNAFGSPYRDYDGRYGSSGSKKGKIILFSSIGAAAVALVVILLVVLLGGGGAGKSPQNTVKAFAKAFGDLDIDGINKCLVPEMREDSAEAKAEISSVRSMLQGFDVSVSNIQDPIYNAEKTECDISATLSIKGTMGGISIAESMGGASGMTGVFHMKKIDGKWLISDMSDMGMGSLF